MIKKPQLPVLENIPFYKMNGLGNDFYILDIRGTTTTITPETAKILGDRDIYGCDQIITLEDHQSDDPDAPRVHMGIWNADGSCAGACGNAARCVAYILTQETYDDPNQLNSDLINFSAPSGILRAARQSKYTYSVGMGKATFTASKIPLAKKISNAHEVILDGYEHLGAASMVSVGNPHMVFFVDDADQIDLAITGKTLSRHEIFPDGANVSFAQITKNDIDNKTSEITLRVWERGAGATSACGTAAYATTAAGIKRGLLQPTCMVNLPGGMLQIDKSNDGLTMTGPVTLEFKGVF